MVPPPDNTGDEFPDFENMSFEEQMAWLESLAKRQGAGEEELTTAADLDVPVPEDVEIDEPGYIPFEGSRSAREMQAAASAASSQHTSEDDEPVASPVGAAETPVSAAFDAEVDDQPLAAEEAVPAMAAEDDPMQWLDSLAVQADDDEQVADLMDDLFAAETEDPLLDIVVEADDVEDAVEEVVAEVDQVDGPDLAMGEASVDAGPDADSDDPLGGMDPMLWLESLAARQGANASELTTTADLEIGDVAEDAVVDEPGYVPFEGSRSAREAAISAAIDADEEPVDAVAEEAEPEPEPDSEREPEPEPEPELSFNLEDVFGDDDTGDAWPEPVADDTGLDTELEDVTDGAESMEWLESLAKRQGAKDEELLTSADVDVPEMPADTVVDEPGYVEYSALSILPPEQPREDLGDVDELADVAEFDGAAADSGLSWLEDLAAEPEEDMAEFLAFEDEVVARHAEEAAEAEPVQMLEDAAAELTEAPAGEGDDLLAGMSDEDIAKAQAQGTLTPHQELAWLKRQARALADTREAEQAALADEELPPAEPGEIPDWLETIRQTSEQEVMALAEDVLDEDVIEGGELPDWLAEPDDGETVPDEDSFVEVALDGDVESLWGEETTEPEPSDLDQLLPDSELAAFVSGEYAADEPDALAEALDEEYERIQSGDDTEPEWYTAAVEKIAAEAGDSVEESISAGDVEETPGAPSLAEAEVVDSPGWLDDIVDEDAALEVAADAVDDDMPDWLREVDEAGAVASSDDVMPDWLTDDIEEPAATIDEGVPDWLADIDEDAGVPEPEVMSEGDSSPVDAGPVEAIPPIEAAREAPVAPMELADGDYEQYRGRLESNPDDHAARLGVARALKASESLEPALEHYEALIEAAELLPDVAEDLSGLVEAQLEQPRVRRLLGDAYMRRGMLSEALNAYRSALLQL